MNVLHQGEAIYSHPLVKEEHVVDEHESTALHYSREEPTEDSRRHKRLKGLGGSRPDYRGERQYEEPEKNWCTSKVRRKHDGEHTASTDHKDISHSRMIDSVGTQTPDSSTRGFSSNLPAKEQYLLYLWKQCNGADSTSEVGQEGGC